MKCSTCGGFEFIPCRKCGGSKNSVANNFTSEFRALRCTHCNENGMEPCPICEKKQSLTIEEKEAIEAAKKEKALQKQLEKEKRDQEKRERIMKEALEAEREKELEEERIQKEKAKKKERAKLEKERKKRAAEIREKVVADIAKELEREKQWQVDHEVEAELEQEPPQDSTSPPPIREVTQDSTNPSPTLEAPQEHATAADFLTLQECPDNDEDSAALEESESATIENTVECKPTLEQTEPITTELSENETETLF